MSAGQGVPTTDIGRPDEIWATGQGLLSEWLESAPDLIWPASVLTYTRMRHDPQLRAVLNAYTLPIRRATWVVDPAGCRDEVVQHTADDLGLGILGADDIPGPARRRGVIWHRHLRQALGHLTFGHMPFERRYRVEAPRPGGVRLDALGVRMPWTIAEINMDGAGQVTGVVQTTQRRPIPASRLVWYVTDQEGANWAGLSMLRPAFTYWLVKHEVLRVHATSIRRFGMGVPGVEAPAGATTAQVVQAQQLASAMRAGDTAGMGVPNGFRAFLMGLTGSVPDALGFLRYLDQGMAKMALAGLIELGQTETGSRALGETFLDLFLLSLQAVADEIAETATSGHPGMPGIVTDLVDQNWGPDEAAPRVLCTDVGDNYQVTAEALNRLLQYGGLTGDPELEAWIRKAWRLPQREEPPAPPAALPAPPAAPVPAAAPHPPGGAGGGVPGGGPPAGTSAPPVAAARRPGTRRGAGPLRRQPTTVEVAAGFDPAGHQQAWAGALDTLVAAWQPVITTWRTDLVEQVGTVVNGGKTARLGALAPDPDAGAGILAGHMEAAAQAAVSACLDELAYQGVHVNPAKVKISAARLGAVATARATMAGGWLGQQASGKALQVVQAAFGTDWTDVAGEAADQVDVFLRSLTLAHLREMLGAALTAAQNHGRVAVLEAAPASAGTATYHATEILDTNTCGPCRDEDGHTFASLPDAEAAYPNGGYLGCLAGLRCRGTVIGLWGGGGQ